MKDKTVRLIGGSGRSGTTILAKIFNNHSQVVVAPEWRFLIDPDGILDFIKNSHRWSPYHVDTQYKRLKKLLLAVADVNRLQRYLNKKIKQSALDNFRRKLLPRYSAISAHNVSPNYLKIVERLFDELSDFKYSGYWVGMPFLAKKEMYYSDRCAEEELVKIFQRFIYLIISDVKEKQNADYYIEKNTWNILWYDEIRQLLPESRLVHIFRDPRDVVASYCGQTWMPSNAKNSAIIYKDIMDRWDTVKRKVPRESFMEISLENLVREPEVILKEVCSFWNIPWETSLLNTNLNRSNMGRWKKQFDENQQYEVEYILKDNLEKLGYE
jgi:hypothetical protein